jgi:hypothetical protein
MFIERVHPSGAWRISDIIDGYRVSRQYFDYTPQEALDAFREEHGIVPEDCCESCGAERDDDPDFCGDCVSLMRLMHAAQTS